jgi:hypothetical protein
MHDRHRAAMLACMLRIIAWGVLLACSLAGAGESRRSGPYLGLFPPDTPEVFHPGMFGQEPLADNGITGLAFSPDLRHVALSVERIPPSGRRYGVIHASTRKGDAWSTPETVASLDAPGFSNGEGSFTADGGTFLFSSDRSTAGPSPPRAYKSSVRNRSFGVPVVVDLELPEGAGVYFPRQLRSGDLSFTSRSAIGTDDLFVAPRTAAGFGKAEPLGPGFNSPSDDWDLIESRDGRLRIWASARDGGVGRTDLYYSRRDATGSWSAPRPISAANTPALETAPSLTPDDRVLFFLRRIAGRDTLFWVRANAVLPP